jgi:hypothetical protein
MKSRLLASSLVLFATIGVTRALNPFQKRVGDATVLSSQAIFAQGVTAATSASSWTAPSTINLGAGAIRGCRIACCVLACETALKAVRRPDLLGDATKQVPVPIEAAGAALLLNLALEFSIAGWAATHGGLPSTLALSLGGAPADVAASYLSLIVWRTLVASTPPGKGE